MVRVIYEELTVMTFINESQKWMIDECFKTYPWSHPLDILPRSSKRKWDEILSFLDSLIHGYPIGAITLWEEPKTLKKFIVDGFRRVQLIRHCLLNETDIYLNIGNLKLEVNTQDPDATLFPLCAMLDTIKFVNETDDLQPSELKTIQDICYSLSQNSIIVQTLSNISKETAINYKGRIHQNV